MVFRRNRSLNGIERGRDRHIVEIVVIEREIRNRNEPVPVVGPISNGRVNDVQVRGHLGLHRRQPIDDAGSIAFALRLELKNVIATNLEGHEVDVTMATKEAHGESEL